MSKVDLTCFQGKIIFILVQFNSVIVLLLIRVKKIAFPLIYVIDIYWNECFIKISELNLIDSLYSAIN